MNAIANTTVAIYRGSVEDSYGDEVDSDTPVKRNIPASLIEGRPREVISGTDQTPRVVGSATLRVNGSEDVRRGDRILDESTGQFYRVDEPIRSGNPAMVNDVRVDLTYQKRQ